MEFLLNAQQMKYCDSDTIEKIGIPSLVLMERAALAVVDETFHAGCDLRSVLVVCGSGNNGGDGFAVARLLDEQGVRVTVAFVGNEDSMTEETVAQRQICENCGIKTSSNFMQREYTVIVDAIFGIGLSREIQGRYAQVIDWINQQSAFKVAVDIPSGVSADTGRIFGTAVQADLTVAFAYRKLGHILFPGTESCGKVVRRDIGITADRFQGGIPNVFTYGEEDLARIARRRPYSNKGTYGKVLLIAGSRGMSGAACLSAMAAYRSGSGLVRVFTPECNREVIQTYLPEAIVTTYRDDVILTGQDRGIGVRSGTLGGDCFSDGDRTVQIKEEGFPAKELEEALAWSDVVGIGPGLGTGRMSEEILATVLSEYRKPLVIDADGLNLLAKNPNLLYETKASVILTPHIGEMMRLTDNTKEEILEDLLQTARQFAREYGVICALKDARTVVSDGSRVYVNTSGNNGMAVGGSGDILTGVICGLLAQKMPAFDAAALGVYLHGLAGDAAQEKRSAYGMIARDIADQIGEVLKQIDETEH